MFALETDTEVYCGIGQQQLGLAYLCRREVPTPPLP